MISLKAEGKSWKGVEITRGGPVLTHLLFADDLMLFGQANIKTCETIREVMDEFCCISGLKINTHKSKLFISPNVDGRRARELSTLCGIPLTHDLGKYLGVPLVHGRLNRGLFNDIVSKMQKRLSGWRASTLSMAGRASLITSATSAIPSYTIQTLLLPKSVCNDIDKMNSNFLWRDTMEKHKIHLVNWDVVCNIKKKGGLGIKKARDQNLALLSKLGWNLIGRNASHVWRGIWATRNCLRRAVKWKVGDGNIINVWKDWWCGECSFERTVLSTLPLSQNNVTACGTVKELIEEDGHWDEATININFSPHLATAVLTSGPPNNLHRDLTM
ncbi:hypothetical protein ACSBR1_027827 [Camellia fascicularis]